MLMFVVFYSFVCLYHGIQSKVNNKRWDGSKINNNTVSFLLNF